MNYRILADELIADPTAAGYAGMTNAQAATSLNSQGRSVPRDTVPSYEVLDAIVPAEWEALNAQEKARIQLILSLGTVLIRGANTRASLNAAFGTATATRAALVALRTESKTRAEEIGIGPVTSRNVGIARGGSW